MADTAGRPPVQGNQFKPVYFVLALATVFTVKDLFLNQLATEEPNAKEVRDMNDPLAFAGKDDAPMSSLHSGLKGFDAGSRLSAGKFVGPTLLFSYWYGPDLRLTSRFLLLLFGTTLISLPTFCAVLPEGIETSMSNLAP